MGLSSHRGLLLMRHSGWDLGYVSHLAVYPKEGCAVAILGNLSTLNPALKARQVVDHVRTCLAIELLVAAQAIDLRAPLRPSRKVAEAHARIRAVVPHLDEDREIHRDMEAVARLVDDGALDL